MNSPHGLKTKGMQEKEIRNTDVSSTSNTVTLYEEHVAWRAFSEFHTVSQDGCRQAWHFYILLLSSAKVFCKLSVLRYRMIKSKWFFGPILIFKTSILITYLVVVLSTMDVERFHFKTQTK